MDEYPKMLLREGSEIEWAGLMLDTRVVHDATEEAEARAEGWLSAGEEAPKAKRKAA